MQYQQSVFVQLETVYIIDLFIDIKLRDPFVLFWYGFLWLICKVIDKQSLDLSFAAVWSKEHSDLDLFRLLKLFCRNVYSRYR